MTIVDELPSLLASGADDATLAAWLRAHAQGIIAALPSVEIEDVAQVLFDAQDSWQAFDDFHERLALAAVRLVRPDFRDDADPR